MSLVGRNTYAHNKCGCRSLEGCVSKPHIWLLGFSLKPIIYCHGLSIVSMCSTVNLNNKNNQGKTVNFTAFHSWASFRQNHFCPFSCMIYLLDAHTSKALSWFLLHHLHVQRVKCLRVELLPLNLSLPSGNTWTNSRITNKCDLAITAKSRFHTLPSYFPILVPLLILQVTFLHRRTQNA